MLNMPFCFLQSDGEAYPQRQDCLPGLQSAEDQDEDGSPSPDQWPREAGPDQTTVHTVLLFPALILKNIPISIFCEGESIVYTVIRVGENIMAPIWSSSFSELLYQYCGLENFCIAFILHPNKTGETKLTFDFLATGSLISPRRGSKRFWPQAQTLSWPPVALMTCVWSTLWMSEPWQWGGFSRRTSSALPSQQEVGWKFTEDGVCVFLLLTSVHKQVDCIEYVYC